MSKSSKGKKNKVPKLTEAEYAQYISSLKGTGERGGTSTVEKENAVQSVSSKAE